jgi:IS5 family transposase
MQSSFSELEYAAKKKEMQHDRLLAQIETVTPWTELVTVLEPFYPKSEGRGHPPIGLARMLRMYIVQQCFGLSDEGMKEAVYDSQAIWRFIGSDLNVDTASDAITLLKFRRMLEMHNLTKIVFDTINGHLAAKGGLLKEDTIVEATIIVAPPFIKNKAGERDPHMHQAKKDKERHFGMKAHIGVDADSGLAHAVVTSAANVNDVTQTHALLYGEQTHAFGDAGYTGVTRREENQADKVTWHVPMKPGKGCVLLNTPLGQLLGKIEHAKASIRAKAEHPFHVLNLSSR